MHMHTCSSITHLPQHAIDCVRADTQVPDLPSAACELVLNSIEAGAHRIQVSVNLAGWSLSVEDNGCGITAASIPLLGQRFCTSRPATGRGETLASLAQVCAQVTIITRAAGSFETHRKQLVLASNNPSTRHAAQLCRRDSSAPGTNPHPSTANTLCALSRQCQGTTVSLVGFLHNQPVRRNRLLQQHGLAGRGPAAARAVAARVQQAAALEEIKMALLVLMLPHTAVELTLQQAGSASAALHMPQDRCMSACFEQLFQQQQSFRTQDCQGWQLTGCVTTVPAAAVGGRQLLYVNRRAVSCPAVSQLLRDWFIKHMRASAGTAGSGQAAGSGSAKGAIPGMGRSPEPAYMLLITCPEAACSTSRQYSSAQLHADFSSSMAQLCALLQEAIGPAWGNIPTAWKAAARQAREQGQHGSSGRCSGGGSGRGRRGGNTTGAEAHGTEANLGTSSVRPHLLPVHGLQMTSKTRSLAGIQVPADATPLEALPTHSPKEPLNTDSHSLLQQQNNNSNHWQQQQQQQQQQDEREQHQHDVLAQDSSYLADFALLMADSPAAEGHNVPERDVHGLRHSAAACAEADMVEAMRVAVEAAADDATATAEGYQCQRDSLQDVLQPFAADVAVGGNRSRHDWLSHCSMSPHLQYSTPAADAIAATDSFTAVAWMDAEVDYGAGTQMGATHKASKSCDVDTDSPQADYEPYCSVDAVTPPVSPGLQTCLISAADAAAVPEPEPWQQGQLQASWLDAAEALLPDADLLQQPQVVEQSPCTFSSVQQTLGEELSSPWDLTTELGDQDCRRQPQPEQVEANMAAVPSPRCHENGSTPVWESLNSSPGHGQQGRKCIDEVKDPELHFGQQMHWACDDSPSELQNGKEAVEIGYFIQEQQQQQSHLQLRQHYDGDISPRPPNHDWGDDPNTANWLQRQEQQYGYHCQPNLSMLGIPSVEPQQLQQQQQQQGLWEDGQLPETAAIPYQQYHELQQRQTDLDLNHAWWERLQQQQQLSCREAADLQLLDQNMAASHEQPQLPDFGWGDADAGLFEQQQVRQCCHPAKPAASEDTVQQGSSLTGEQDDHLDNIQRSIWLQQQGQAAAEQQQQQAEALGREMGAANGAGTAARFAGTNAGAGALEQQHKLPIKQLPQPLLPVFSERLLMSAPPVTKKVRRFATSGALIGAVALRNEGGSSSRVQTGKGTAPTMLDNDRPQSSRHGMPGANNASASGDPVPGIPVSSRAAAISTGVKETCAFSEAAAAACCPVVNSNACLPEVQSVGRTVAITSRSAVTAGGGSSSQSTGQGSGKHRRHTSPAILQVKPNIQQQQPQQRQADADAQGPTVCTGTAPPAASQTDRSHHPGAKRHKTDHMQQPKPAGPSSRQLVQLKLPFQPINAATNPADTIGSRQVAAPPAGVKAASKPKRSALRPAWRLAASSKATDGSSAGLAAAAAAPPTASAGPAATKVPQGHLSGDAACAADGEQATKPRKRVRFSGIDSSQEAPTDAPEQQRQGQHPQKQQQQQDEEEEGLQVHDKQQGPGAADETRLPTAATQAHADSAPSTCAAEAAPGTSSAPLPPANVGCSSSSSSRHSSRFFQAVPGLTAAGGGNSRIAVLGLSQHASVGSSDQPILTLDDLVGPGASVQGGLLQPQIVRRQQLQDGQVLGQADQKMVLARCGPVLLAIDQHAADERIQLEALQHHLRLQQHRQHSTMATQQILGRNNMPSQPLVSPSAKAAEALVGVRSNTEQDQLLQSQLLQPPLLMNLSVQEAKVLGLYQHLIASWGWCISTDCVAGSSSTSNRSRSSLCHSSGGGSSASAGAIAGTAVSYGSNAGAVQGALLGATTTAWLKQVPVLAGVQLGAVDLQLYLHQLLETSGSSSQPPPGVVRTLKSKACRQAIMFGDQLSQQQCEALLQKLAATELCFMCAHGRPTTTALVDLTHLARRLQQRAGAESLGAAAGGSMQQTQSQGGELRRLLLAGQRGSN